MNLLHADIVKQIPKSTLHRFKNSDYSDIFGFELAASLEQNENFVSYNKCNAFLLKKG